MFEQKMSPRSSTLNRNYVSVNNDNLEGSKVSVEYPENWRGKGGSRSSSKKHVGSTVG